MQRSWNKKVISNHLSFKNEKDGHIVKEKTMMIFGLMEKKKKNIYLTFWNIKQKLQRHPKKQHQNKIINGSFFQIIQQIQHQQRRRKKMTEMMNNKKDCCYLP